MKYIITGSEFQSLPYCMAVDSENETTALMKINTEEYSHYLPQFLFNMDNGKCFRIVRNWEGEEHTYEFQETAFDVFGIETPDSYLISEDAK
jgi:hypothetical protein